MNSKLKHHLCRVFEICEAFLWSPNLSVPQNELPRWWMVFVWPSTWRLAICHILNTTTAAAATTTAAAATTTRESFVCRTTKDKAIMRHSINFIYFISAPSTWRCPGKEVFRSLARSWLNQATNSQFDGRQHCCLIPRMPALAFPFLSSPVLAITL